MRERVSSDRAPAAVGPYSQAIRAGGFVWVSGQIPLDPKTGQMADGGIEVQTRRVIENLRAVLDAAGSGLDRVVKSTVYLTNMADFEAMNRVYGECFPEPPPARSTVQVGALPRGARVEIDVVAVEG